MVTLMPRKPLGIEPPAPRADDGAITSVKCFKRLARMITQLGHLRDKTQQEVMETYASRIEEDLLRELARRQTEIRSSRRDPR